MNIEEAAKQAMQNFYTELERYDNPFTYTAEEAGQWVADEIVALMNN